MLLLLLSYNYIYLVLLSLLTPVSKQLVIEGNNITVNLTVGGANTPFPPLLTSQWRHEGQPLLSNGNNDIILTDFIITLTNVQRNQSGITIYLLLVMMLDQLLLVLY